MGITQIHGRLGENAACKLLKQKGYTILERNFRKRCGEIDIIAQQGDTISFVEVKTRNSTAYGQASEAVTYQKQKRLIRTAELYIMEKGLDAAFSFDIVEVYHTGRKVTAINHIENAFYA